jgi:ERCC4-type nuclease
MTKKIVPPPTILIDTREKQPFEFAWAASRKKIAGVETATLSAGDYTIKEIPNLVIVERKKNVGEIYGNLIPKEKYERFVRELEKLKEYEHRYIVVEQEWAELWDASNFKFARRNKNWAGSMVLSHLIAIETDYNVHVHFAGEYAEQLTLKLLVKNYERKYENQG